MMTVRVHWEDLQHMDYFDIQDYRPFALYHSLELLAELPIRAQTVSPLDVFSKTTQSKCLRNFHVWGCPIYVLETQKIPHWKARSRLGLYLEKSPTHASNVAMVLNIKFRRVSPQYQVVLEDQFNTVRANHREHDKLWMHLYSTRREFFAGTADIHRGLSITYNRDAPLPTTDIITTTVVQHLDVEPISAIDRAPAVRPSYIDDTETSADITTSTLYRTIR